VSRTGEALLLLHVSLSKTGRFAEKKHNIHALPVYLALHVVFARFDATFY